MTPEKLLAHFDRLSAESDAVPLLRRFILDLAVRGKLVEQHNNEPSPLELLRQIQMERDRLIPNRKVGTEEKRPIQDDEVPFPIPPGVVFARLSAIARIEKGSTGIQSATPGKYPLVTLAKDRATSSGYQFDAAATLIPLISSTGHGHASLKRIHYQEGKFALGNILCAVLPFAPDFLSARFLFEYLWAYNQPLLVEKMTGTANVSLTIGKIGEAPIPIISVRSQKRLHELMVLCDRLELAQAERDRRRDRLNSASLKRLNQLDSDARVFCEHARFHLQHQHKFSSQPEHMALLRQTIVNLAIRGLLTTQYLDAENELEPELVRMPESTPYELPVSWQWCILGDVVSFVGGSQPPKSSFIYEPRDGYTRLIQIRDFKSDQNLTFVPTSKANRPFLPDDIMIGRYGPPVFQILRGLEGTYNVALMKATPTSRAITKAYLFYLLQESRIHDQVVKESERTAGQTGIRIPLLNSFSVALPPRAEQARIVAKIEDLMTLCDRIEVQLFKKQTVGHRLLEAVLHQALAPSA